MRGGGGSIHHPPPKKRLLKSFSPLKRLLNNKQIMTSSARLITPWRRHPTHDIDVYPCYWSGRFWRRLMLILLIVLVRKVLSKNDIDTIHAIDQKVIRYLYHSTLLQRFRSRVIGFSIFLDPTCKFEGYSMHYVPKIKRAIWIQR